MLTAVACGLLGLLIGSFLNVVIARVPTEESIVTPASRCPACGVPIAPRDNMPVLSWLLLRGRARCCGVRISARYPLVEAGTALAFALVALRFGPVAELTAFLYLAAISIALAMIDIDTFRLPYVIVAPSAGVLAVLLTLAAVADRDGAAVVRTFGGAAALWVFYRLLHALYPAGMGYGDVRLAALLGGSLGFLGWGQLVVGAFLGFLVGGLAGIVVIALRRGGWKSQVPYGPYMLTGTWLSIGWGGAIADWYLRAAGL